ncbi:hypothetical protein ITX44_34055 [Streptomyces sp. KK5PA1]|uniref:Intein C-terminal splicing domain-containing protein n=1 Tax=Actinacidiphila acididurans TaxID=2784346 RepID=A0ABS2U2B2_9ACTN|nr:hypothetical protein [Actinacidiphila acididurans]
MLGALGASHHAGLSPADVSAAPVAATAPAPVDAGPVRADSARAAAHAGPSVTPSAPADGRLTTTFHHPFYDETRTAFVEAKSLHVGDLLQTPTGSAQVTSLHLFHAHTTTYDLTVGDLHTYYVEAGGTPVLVHNCGNEEIAAQLKSRVDDLHNLLPEGAQGRRSTAIIRAVDGDGNFHDVVGWSGGAKRGLDRLIKEGLQDGEEMSDRVAGDAETSALSHIRSQGWTPIAGASNRPVCPWCQNALFDSFSKSVGPARSVGPSDGTAILGRINPCLAVEN